VADQWPEIRPEENPVGFVTNGVHVPTFLHQTWADFFDQEWAGDWRERLRDLDFWNALDRVPDDRYWVTSQSVKSRMLASVPRTAAARIRSQRYESGAVTTRDALPRSHPARCPDDRLCAAVCYL